MTTIDIISIGISVVSLICTLITVWAGLRKNQRDTVKAQLETAAELAAAEARREEQIKELTREVRKHNNFAERMPVLEEKIKVANHRIDDLEGKVHD